MESYPGVAVQVQCEGRGRTGGRKGEKKYLSNLSPFKEESSYRKEESKLIKTDNYVFITIHKLKNK